MKVRIDYEEEVTKLQRKAIAYHYGLNGLASRQNVIDFFMMYGNGSGVLDNFVHQYKRSCNGFRGNING
jgi:hypothetical protein